MPRLLQLGCFGQGVDEVYVVEYFHRKSQAFLVAGGQSELSEGGLNVARGYLVQDV